ncbi:MAG: hypothetical protein ACRD0K_06315 [Egibacteraceae bacterium]
MTLGQEIWIPQRLAMAAVCVESAAVADCQYLAQQSIRQARGLGELYGLDLSPLVEAYEGEMKTAYEAYAALERMGRPLPCGQLRFLGNLLNGKREDYVGMSMHSGPNILGGGGPRLTDSMGASWTAMASSQARRGTTTPDLLTRCDNRCGVASRQMAFPSRPAPHANRNAAADFDGGHKLTRPTAFLRLRRKTAAQEHGLSTRLQVSSTSEGKPQPTTSPSRWTLAGLARRAGGDRAIADGPGARLDGTEL